MPDSESEQLEAEVALTAVHAAVVVSMAISITNGPEFTVDAS